MKQYQLQAIAHHLNQFNYISRARRVEDNTIEVVFEKHHSYLFTMTRGNSFIYKAPSHRPIQNYNAPLDTLLQSLLSASKIIEIDTIPNERVLRIKVAPKSTYKDEIVVLQLEFTGKNTNAILLDENEVIIEALRHIDAQSSFRVIRPGITLVAIPPYQGSMQTGELKDVDGFLESEYQKIESQKLATLRKQKLISTQKKIDRLCELITKLPSQTQIEAQITQYANYAHLILAYLYNIKPYDKELRTYDFEGNHITIPFPKAIKINRLSDYFFGLSKRAKNRAKNIHIERDNLESKKVFYENIYYAIEQSKKVYELELLVPKRAKSLRKKEHLREGELFWIEDYKVLVGRNSTENQKLLAIAKSNDTWMHLRDIPSSHVIIRTDKQNLPDSVIYAAAKLCVDFSVKSSGDYEVDYTKRKFVKIQEASNVLYTNHHTVRVTKEGVEIRI